MIFASSMPSLFQQRIISTSLTPIQLAQEFYEWDLSIPISDKLSELAMTVASQELDRVGRHVWRTAKDVQGGSGSGNSASRKCMKQV